MRGGTITASWLKAQGVTHLFVLVGEHILPLLDGCAEVGIQVIGARHESNAVLEAEAFARVTGRPGVAAVTAGPGVTNAVTGLAVANTCGSPVMLLTGRTSTAKRLTGAFQDTDGTAIVEPVTKWTDTCFRTDRLTDYLSIAWRRMLGGRPGSVMIELPHDVLKGEADTEIAALQFPEPAGASPEAVRRTLSLLSEAERPIIVVGSGAFWSHASDSLRAFAERARIPVCTLNAARGLIPDGDEVCIGGLGDAGLVLPQADVVLLVGSKLDTSVTFGGPPLFSGNEKLIQVDIEPSWIGFNRQPHLGVAGDARTVLQQLADGWDGKPKDGWLSQAKEFGAQMHAAWEGQTAPLEGSPVPPGRVPAEIIKAAGREAILVSDGGDIHTWCVTTMPAFRPGSLLTTHDSLGTIGVGVPYALGAKAANPDRPVLMCIGDGSFGFGALELETAARNNLPIVAVVANNGQWGNIRHEQQKQFGKKTNATELSAISYEKFAEAVGGHAERVEDASQLGAAIGRARDSGKVAVVNVLTQPGVVSPITEMVGEMMAML
jgi:thiamine pyrophosphate-dependent acetolactate synthase large subunit-like protein